MFRKPRSHFGRSGDSEPNQEAENVWERNEGRGTGKENSTTFGGTEEKEEDSWKDAQAEE